MINHIEACKKIKKAGDKVCKNKRTARKFLIKIGLINKDGSLHVNYR